MLRTTRPRDGAVVDATTACAGWDGVYRQRSSVPLVCTGCQGSLHAKVTNNGVAVPRPRSPSAELPHRRRNPGSARLKDTAGRDYPPRRLARHGRNDAQPITPCCLTASRPPEGRSSTPSATVVTGPRRCCARTVDAHPVLRRWVSEGVPVYAGSAADANRQAGRWSGVPLGTKRRPLARMK